ncbi:unnamed protein product [Brachionus calyciflorus]|uniref:Uncharacterized protein n=1 Tax=Brachionus calyciflorus TaxID=104777 RepID=A0A814THK1_9BILA|nr:unnamed protein product [Brachionus calyciflorus]
MHTDHELKPIKLPEQHHPIHENETEKIPCILLFEKIKQKALETNDNRRSIITSCLEQFPQESAYLLRSVEKLTQTINTVRAHFISTYFTV